MKQSTIQYKLAMAGTGLFLCFFLVIHLLGNLQLLLPASEAREQFNWYSHLLAGNMLIKIVSWVLLLSIIAHAVYALILAFKTRKANGTKYVYDKRPAVSPWNSRNMGLLGTVILLFLVIHLKDFWYVADFTEMAVDKQGYKDMCMRWCSSLFISGGMCSSTKYPSLPSVSIYYMDFSVQRGPSASTIPSM